MKYSKEQVLSISVSAILIHQEHGEQVREIVNNGSIAGVEKCGTLAEEFEQEHKDIAWGESDEFLSYEEVLSEYVCNWIAEQEHKLNENNQKGNLNRKLT